MGLDQPGGRASGNGLLVILNDDDLLMPDCLEKIVATFEANADIYMLGGSSLWFDDSTTPPAARRRSRTWSCAATARARRRATAS